MLVKELIGKIITNIYITSGIQDGWLDTAECFIELDNSLIIDIPYGFSDEVWIKELDPKSESIFKDLADYPVYNVNKQGKSIGQIADAYQKRKRNIFNRIISVLRGKELIPKEYLPYKKEYQENKLKYIQHRKIIDFLWYDDESEKGFIELDNGYIVSETTMSPRGTGQAGLNYYASLLLLIETKGDEIKRLTDVKKDNC